MMTITNIVIIGITGVGKTTVGKIVAEQLGRKFIDLDKMIEQRCGVDIATIFSIEGESGFRARETDELRRIIQEEDNFVLSVGGGAILSAENRRLMSYHFVIQLFANINVIVHRLSKSHGKRPLFQNTSIQQKVMDLYKARQEHYNQLSDLNINTSNSKPESVGEFIAEYINKINHSPHM